MKNSNVAESIYLSRGWTNTPPPHIYPPQLPLSSSVEAKYTSPGSPDPPAGFWNSPPVRSGLHKHHSPPERIHHIHPHNGSGRRAAPIQHIGAPGALGLIDASPSYGGAVSSEPDPYYNPALAPSHRRGRGKPKKNGANQTSFLTKLYSEQPDYHHIIRWDDRGEIIIIEKPDELAEKVLPAVYRQSRFASFSRQLNIYGFMRKVSLRHTEAGIIDPDASTWSHQFLHRDSPQADIINFKRRVPPRPSQSRRRSSMIEEIALSPSSSEGSPHSHPDPYAHHLLRDHEDQAKPFAPLGGLPRIFAQPQSPPLERVEPTWGGIAPKDPDRVHSFTESPDLPAHQPQPTFLKPIPGLDSTDTATPILPHTAPAFAHSFPGQMQVTQGHLRTRSVQGEPPSATLWSPGSPLGGGWMMPSDDSDSEPEPSPSLWLQRSITTGTQPATIAAPAFEGLPRALLEGTGGGGSFGPSSLPHDFAPGAFALGAPVAYSTDFDYATASSNNVLRSPFGVSSLPTYHPYLPSTLPKRHPVKGMTKLYQHVRRHTLTSPYNSPKVLAAPLAPNNSTGNYCQRHDVHSDAEDGGLPSGGLRMEMEIPFEQVLGSSAMKND